MAKEITRVVVDENIPFVHETFGRVADVRTLSGRAMSPEIVRDADVLLVRSVTRVDKALLANSRVRFVGSTTIGTDHIDRAYLREQGIGFAHAPGSNATSVVEYVLASLLWVAVRKGVPLRGKTVGIIGMGNIGSRLGARLPALGMRVLANDPPLEVAAKAAGQAHDFVSLERVLIESDIISLHVPLEREGPYATRHLIDDAALAKMRPGTWLINTCRGAVVDNPASRRAIEADTLGSVIFDVWEGEPEPSPELVRLADVATPHIAGYSFDGKVLGTTMVYEAFVEQFGLPHSWDPETVLSGSGEDQLDLRPPENVADETSYLFALVRQMYDIAADDAQMRVLPDLPREEQGSYFTALRKSYPRRRTFGRFKLPAEAVPDAYHEAVRDGLLVDLI